MQNFRSFWAIPILGKHLVECVSANEAEDHAENMHWKQTVLLNALNRIWRYADCTCHRDPIKEFMCANCIAASAIEKLENMK
jgi:hypothetical protein